MHICKLVSLFCLFSTLTTFSQLLPQSLFQLSFLDEEYENIKYSKHALKELRIQHVEGMLSNLKKQFPVSFQFEEIGRSIENRSIYLVRLGKGTTKILLWSQMHGNEPTATAALFDVFHYLMKNKDKPFVKNILNKITILAVPMLNPDGADKFKRRNAQGLDINRDARDRQSPEGQILFQLQQTYRPDFGFNLHDQNARRTAGKTNKLVAIALMAPPYDSNDNDNPVRLRAKKIVSVIYEALGPYLYGHISKYDAEYMPRAFGDSMQYWGLSTILIESGGWYSERDAFLQKMNFIALVTVFDAIANESYTNANPAIYDILPENDRNLYDILIQDVMVFSGTGIPPFRTDVAINYNSEKIGMIADLGDLNIFAAKDTINGDDLYLTPGFVGVLNDFSFEEKELISELRKMLKSGMTTILVSFKNDQIDKISEFEKIIDNNQFSVNVGGILYLDYELKSSSDTLQVLRYLGKNMIGVIGKDSSITKFTLARILKKPAVALADANLAAHLESLNFQKIKSLTSEQAELWKIPKRGKIQIGQIADLVLFSKDSQSKPVVNTIFIKGYPVSRGGEWINVPVKGENWFTN